MLSSWRTTLAAVGGILAIVGNALNLLLDDDPATNPDWALVIPGLVTAIGLLFARDNAVSSEDAGAKPPEG